MSSYESSGDPEKGEAGLHHTLAEEQRVDAEKDLKNQSVDADPEAARKPSTAQTCTDSSTTSTKPLLRTSISESSSKYASRLNSAWTFTKSSLTPKKGITLPDPIIQNVPTMPDGYPRLGAFLDSDDNFMLYRRFGYLQSRLLLEKQDDLRLLEEELGRLDRRHGKKPESTMAVSLKTRQESEEPYVLERNASLGKIEAKWLEYSNLLLAARSMTSMNRPSESEFRSVNRYVRQENPVFAPEARFVLHKEDLVTLRPGREHAWLDASLEHLLRWCNCGLVEWIFRSKETKEKTDGQDGSVYYTRSRIERLAMMIVLLMILVLLVVPIYILNNLTDTVNDPHSNSVCVGVLLVFTLAFSACVSLFTRAGRHEILAASAAYCAVLVVFIGSGRIAGGS